MCKAVLRAAVAVAVVGAAALTTVAYSAPPQVASAQGFTLTRTASGLLAEEPFDTARPFRDIEDGYEFNGSATPGTGYVRVAASGLKVGVHQHGARFEGWFAVTRKAYPRDGVYHVDMSRPAGNVSGDGNQGEAVFAVQTGTTKQNGLINYVVVASNSAGGVTSWLIGYSHGHLADARLETLSSTAPSPSAATSEGVTLRTDGRRSFEVWFGASRVYASDALALDIAPPYQPYLEVQARRIAYESSFQDFWITSSDAITVQGLPAGEQVELVGKGGDQLASSVVRGSAAVLRPPLPQCRGSASLLVRRPGHTVQLGPFSYACGDTYRVR